HVQQSAGRLPPSFKIPLTNQEVTEGKSVVLHCELNKPAASVEWRRGGEPLKNGDNIKTTDNGECTLAIKNLISSDSGIYTCEVVNKFGVTSYNGNITVAQTAQLAPVAQKSKASSIIGLIYYLCKCLSRCTEGILYSKF
uniref:Ig-like domain-containing protein n=1 Tax=Amphilophus citrinellus TaxID=61819 RepID=A0A3Q0S108_AMPCI